MQTVDLSEMKVVAVRDVERAGKAGVKEVVVNERGIVTPAARDLLNRYGITLRINGHSAPPAVAAKPAPAAGAYGASPNGKPSSRPEHERLFRSPESEAIKQEICAVGRKLWQRAYVDGNGGNISYRIGPNEVICTPTLISKADLKPEDLCLVDLQGNQLVGARPRTSEILLHLEIYKAQPAAKAVVHCHPPHATAYAITGRVPPQSLIPEYDVFVGNVAVAPYETPGTQKFAETVLPWVQQYNTLLLSNHGIVCWADTVTHAEWYAEVLETYCQTVLISAQLGAPITPIPPDKAAELLSIKKKLGLPDARFNTTECQLSDMPNIDGTIALPPPRPCRCESKAGDASGAEVDAIVQAVTDSVMAALTRKP